MEMKVVAPIQRAVAVERNTWLTSSRPSWRCRGGGHLNAEAGVTAFPELRDAILSSLDETVGGPS